ncbi:MAG: ATP-binding protein [Methanobrevibacter sp.]|nr:ATP-binding protein [Methanobrevibacter sp.]
MTFEYKPRLIDDEIDEYLEMIGAILIEGPKWCGKTTTAEQHAKSSIKLQDTDQSENYLRWAKVQPSILLEGKKPRLIDEWQMAPILWDAVRNSVDELHEDGLYILTGSTTIDEAEVMHTGTGRIHRVVMRTMSLFESGESNGKISILELFENPDMPIDGIESTLSVTDLIFAACRGGWPESLNKKSEKAQLFVAKSYVKNICEINVSSFDDVKRDPQKVRNILKSYSRNISTLASNSTILADINSEFQNISKNTYYNYINALKRLFVIEDVPAWSPNIRSKSSIRSTPKKEFTDPSIAVATMGLSPQSLVDDLNTFGFIFETLCIRDLRVYTSKKWGEISYYRDRNGLEADCVIHLENGDYALIEFKLGSDEIEKGAKNLLKLRNLLKEKNFKEPKFLAVITGGKYAYTTEDNVKVIPIGCLR